MIEMHKVILARHDLTKQKTTHQASGKLRDRTVCANVRVRGIIFHAILQGGSSARIKHFVTFTSKFRHSINFQ